MNEIQDILFYLLKTVDRICKNNDIEYCISWGTLLGAVRHHNFIPWDDDIDIFMTTNNFIKFKKRLSELPSDLSFTDQNIKTKSPPKILYKNKEIQTKDGSNRIFLDIFPISFLNEKEFKDISFYNNIHKIWEKRIDIKKRSLFNYFFYRMLTMPLHKWEERQRMNLMKKIRDYNLSDGTYICYAFDDHCNDICFPWKDIYPFKKIHFNGILVPCPKNTDVILRICYGHNYMTPIITNSHIKYKNDYL